MAKHQFVWFDLETTGLDEHAPGAAILEWAIVLAADDRDGDMAPVDQFSGLIEYPGADPRAAMDPYVVGMHTKNGLLAELEAGSGLPLADTDEALEGIARELCPDGKITLAGNSVHFDLRWCRRFLPRFAARCMHRVVDVSSIKEVERAWFAPFELSPADAHRALPDALASLASAKAWRERHASAIFAAETECYGFYGNRPGAGG